ncbi:hypothetical protein PflCFBP13510_12335 [Pseudomonas fluorescens]|jgi:hypothetical protein|uniref:DUF2846 domain-containing protein n=1 Tax=Pseudomonas sp. SST3 TaxID=2267882 RepID=UPI0010C0FB50|nr:DUF2846 domain-containing protein [Pseudomonas sp. SST3]NKQ13512.1 DUF2846 domain-containing protein [Pseudomonas sp. SST3]TKK11783.1 hypothetical protein PflCFBP13510_12335 [Pseudomonas fluorescens]
MTQARKISVFVLLGLLSSCTMTGPKFTPLENVDSQRGVIYVYRPSNYDMGLMSALISLDGKQVASLENGGYVAVPVAPGEHTITQKWKAGILGNSNLESGTTTTMVEVQSSGASYVSLTSSGKRVEAHRFNAVAVELKWQLNQVSADQALPEISQCRKVEAI